MIEVKLTGEDQIQQMLDYWQIWWPSRSLRLFGDAATEDARLRLEDDTSGPDGQTWARWSNDYAKTRTGRHKLLYSDGNLADSLDFRLRGGSTQVGSPLPYAEVHQSGSRDGSIEARPYVGVSKELSAAIDEIYASDFDRGWSAVRT